jgi:tetratricopeptide (TPR) repeat protein
MLSLKYRLAAAAALLASTAAQAEWRQAKGRHFVVYADATEDQIRESATRLEQLDALMRLISATPKELDEGANVVTVYTVRNEDAIRKLMGRGGQNVAGFYLPRVSGSVAYTPAATSADDFSPQLVLFHEYGHHFLLGNYAAPYPAWFSEGYAEYMATTKFDATDVRFGVPAQHRVYGLAYAMPVKRLFDGRDTIRGPQEMDAMYGRGWLLTHMIVSDPAMAGRFNAYLDKLSAGVPSVEAATQAFGKLSDFNRTVDAYLSRNKFVVKQMARSRLPIAPIAIRTLTAGEAAMIGFRMRSDRGVDEKQAKALLAQAAPVAAAHPNDAVAQGWLAEIAYDAKQDDLAEAAADRAIAADPKSAQALLYKARVHLRRAIVAKAEPDAAAWKEARSWIVRANKVDTNDADALMLYYDSFAMAGAPPTRSAILGLKRATQLVPQDGSLRWRAARQFLLDGDVDEAKMLLRPLAFDPHAAPDNPAAKLVALLDGGAKGPDAIATLEAQAKAAK